jgi:rubrerythrin
MDGVGSTKDNLMAGAIGEHYEFTRMYPPFIEQAETDNNKRAKVSFRYANEVEQIHHKYFEEAIKTFETGPKEVAYYVCQVCGNTVPGEAPENCSICGAPHSSFTRVE